MHHERGSAARRRTSGVQSVIRDHNGKVQPAQSIIQAGASSSPAISPTVAPAALDAVPITPANLNDNVNDLNDLNDEPTLPKQPPFVVTGDATTGEMADAETTATEETAEAEASEEEETSGAVETLATPEIPVTPDMAEVPAASHPVQVSSGPRQHDAVNDAISAANVGEVPAPQSPPAWQMPPSMPRAFPLSPQPNAVPYPVQPGQQAQPAQQPQQLPTHVPWQAADSWGATTLNISTNTIAGASYLFWWVSGLLVYFSERNNRYVRFHALQSIILTSILTVCAVCDAIFAAIVGDLAAINHHDLFVPVGWGIVVLLALTILFLWLLSMIAAWTGNYLRLPLIGVYAERYAAPPVQPARNPFF